jgi:hypothetical protein
MAFVHILLLLCALLADFYIVSLKVVYLPTLALQGTCVVSGMFLMLCNEHASTESWP